VNKLDVSEAAKAITCFVFREGPIEDMHANGQIRQDDMKRLNKYMVDNMAFILCLIDGGHFDGIEMIAKYYQGDTVKWDKADITESKRRFEALTEFANFYANNADDLLKKKSPTE
jgi:hypothetical protein